MMRYLLIAILTLTTYTQVLSAQPGSPPSGSKGASAGASPSQPARPPQPQPAAEGEKEEHVPVGYYMLAAIGAALVLVVVCMPSRKGT